MKQRVEINKKHILFTSTYEVREICAHLFKSLGISFFEFTRIYDDGSRVSLTTNPTRTNHVYESDYKESTNYNKQLLVPNKGFVLWEHGKYLLPKKSQPLIEKKIAEGRNYHNVDNGIALYQRGTDYYDYFNFGSTPDNYEIIATYLRNIDFLELFTFYFKDRANKLINKACEQKFILSDYFNKHVKLEKILLPEKNILYNIMDIKRFHFQYNHKDVYITSKEFNCIKLLSCGKSIKEISRLVNISTNTVITYLSNAQNRLNCDKNHLIDIFNINFKHITK